MARRRARSDGDEPRRSAYDKALGMLARREHSRRELRARLERSGYDEGEAESALDRLGTQRYQDDRRFAEMLLRSRAAQGYGPLRVRAELASHGLDAAAIAALLQSTEVDWEAGAAALLRRRHGGKPAADYAERGRLAQFLLRRGFPAATVRRVTHAEVDDTADD
jgi:regulatory protein